MKLDRKMGSGEAIQFLVRPLWGPGLKLRGQNYGFWSLISRTGLVTSALPVSTKLGRNTWMVVRMNRFVAKFWFFSIKGSLVPKNRLLDSILQALLGVSNSKTVYDTKKFTREANPMACLLLDGMNPIVGKRIPWVPNTECIPTFSERRVNAVKHVQSSSAVVMPLSFNLLNV